MRAAVTTIGTCRGSRSHAPHEVRERGRPAPTAIWMLAGQTPTIVAVASIPPRRRVVGSADNIKAPAAASTTPLAYTQKRACPKNRGTIFMNTLGMLRGGKRG